MLFYIYLSLISGHLVLIQQLVTHFQAIHMYFTENMAIIVPDCVYFQFVSQEKLMAPAEKPSFCGSTASAMYSPSSPEPRL